MQRTETEPFKLRRAGSLQGFRKEGFIPAENKQDSTNNRDTLNDIEAVNKLPEPRFLKPKIAVQGEPDKRTGSITVTGEVNGTPIEILVDTGASTNMIRSSTFDQLKEPRKLMRYRGLLEAADGRYVNVRGSATIHLKMGGIDDECEVLIIDGLKTEMIFGLRDLQKHNCVIDLQTNQLWTAPVESAIIPLNSGKLWGTSQNGNTKPTHEAETKEAVHQILEKVGKEDQVEVMMASGSNYDEDGGHDDNLGPNREEEEETLAEGAIRSQQNLCLNSGDEFKMQAGEDVVPLNSPEQEAEQILKKCAPEARGDHWIALRDLVIKYRDVFALDDSELGSTDVVEHRIETGSSKPIKVPPHRISPARIPIIREEIRKMLARGVIQPSRSPYSAPIVLQKKKDGSWRFCVDYRKLNDVTVKDAYPMPNQAQVFDALRGNAFFSSVDLASGYWQVPVAAEHRHKTAFVTPDGGLYEYVRMPFGLSNAPATFQGLMNELFQQSLYQTNLIFLDDVLTYSKTAEDHLKHLEEVFVTLRNANLKLKPKKCQLFQRQVMYLGRVIGVDGTSPDPEKTSKVKEWPVPKTVRDVRSFIGFANYYRRFIKNFASIAKPLHDLTKKSARFEWTPAQQASFDQLRLELVTAPVLQYPDYSGSFIVDTDASNVSIGAVLSNEINGVDRPLVFSSRVLSRTEMMYSTTKREALAVIQALKWYRPYLLGVPFVLRTDHASLRWMFRQDADGMTFRMIQKLQEFDFMFVHRAGNQHGNADGLSRRTSEEPDWAPGEREELTGSCPEPVSLEVALARTRESCGMIREEVGGGTDSEEDALDGQAIVWSRETPDVEKMQQEDEAISRVFLWLPYNPGGDLESFGSNLVTREEAVQHGPEVLAYWSRWNELTVRKGILYRRWYCWDGKPPILQIVVPVVGRKEILDQLHASPVSGGHFAVEKTLRRIRQRFWWPHMRQDVEKKLAWCLPCAARTTVGRKRIGGLVPFKVGIRFHTVAADILSPVTMANETRAKHILVMTDLFTKYVVSVPLKGTEAPDVAKEIVESWILRFGVPDVLHTDQGKNFGSELMLEVCRLLKIDKTRTSPYHPQGNGQVERHNRVIADVISKYCADNPRTWDKLLPYLSFIYNTTIHRTTQATPYSLVYGQECQYPIDLFYPKPHDEELTRDSFAEDLSRLFREAHASARESLGVNQRRQKDQYHKKVYGKPYEKQDKVWVYSKHKAKSRKFFLPWEGPYVVLERTSEVNYKVAKPSQMAKWRILHYNMLKPYLEEGDAWSPKEKKRTTALRSEGFLEHPNVDQDDWEEEGFDLRPTEQNARMRRLAQRRERNEGVEEDVPNLEELFHEQVVTEPARVPEEIPTDGGRLEAPVTADDARTESPLREPGQLAQDQPSGVPEPREVTVVSPDTGPARRPRREIRPVIRLGIDE